MVLGSKGRTYLCFGDVWLKGDMANSRTFSTSHGSFQDEELKAHGEKLEEPQGPLIWGVVHTSPMGF